MDASLRQTSIEDYAALQAGFGVAVVCRDGLYWRRVRPGFYRPVLPLESQMGGRPYRPLRWPSACQFAAGPGDQVNSTMNFVVLEDLANYSLGGLSHRRRHMITHAAKRFAVRPIVDAQELKAGGHRVYLSFFERTGYGFGSDRQQKEIFDRWVDTLYSQGNALVLGGFEDGELAAVSTSFWVQSTLVYASLFCATEAMKANVGEVMFHEFRLLAGRQPGITRVYVRNYHGGSSRDRYYLVRGCTVLRLPARLVLPFPLVPAIRWVMPGLYSRLKGN